MHSFFKREIRPEFERNNLVEVCLFYIQINIGGRIHSDIHWTVSAFNEIIITI